LLPARPAAAKARRRRRQAQACTGAPAHFQFGAFIGSTGYLTQCFLQQPKGHA
jgi:hypothetical protein